MSTPFHSSSNTTPDAPTGTSNVAIVTGAASGIGLEVTKRLAAKGYRVVANSRNITSTMTLQATGDLNLVDGDIGLPETAQRVVAAAMRDFGRIDLLVNNCRGLHTQAVYWVPARRFSKGDGNESEAKEIYMQTVSVRTSITNGVNVDDLTKTIQAVKAQPEIAKFKFNVSNCWLGGAHNRSTVNGFRGAMQDNEHASRFVMDAGEHPVLLGNDEGANPVEFLLHALAACVTTSIVYHAAGQGIEIEAIESKIEGDLDLRGFLGIDPNVRNGYERIRVTMKIMTNASELQWAKLAAIGPAFSPVFDSVTKGVPIDLRAERM